jgi:pyruvate dehydrogenase E1 component
MGSGAILTEVLRAAVLLRAEGMGVEVISVTSWSELARDRSASPWLTQLLQRGHGPVVAASDYVRLVPESVRAQVPSDRRYITLGTDGFGCSDTRARLREHFGVDAGHIARAAMAALKG